MHRFLTVGDAFPVPCSCLWAKLYFAELFLYSLVENRIIVLIMLERPHVGMAVGVGKGRAFKARIGTGMEDEQVVSAYLRSHRGLW